MRWLIVGIVLGLLAVVGGVISSGAGHGPYPELSIKIAAFGLFVAAISLVTIIIASIRKLYLRKKQ